MKENTPKSSEWLKLVTLSETQVKELISRKLSRASIYSINNTGFFKNTLNFKNTGTYNTNK